jgi:translation elongation factor P/translation initiation factor 5A
MEDKFKGMEHELVECSQVRKKDIILDEKSNPPRFVSVGEISTSKPGKHGVAKFNFMGTNVVTKKTAEVKTTGADKLRRCKLIKHQASLILLNEWKSEFEAFNEDLLENITLPLEQVPTEALAKIREILAKYKKSQGENPDEPEWKITFKYVETPYFIDISEINVEK